MQLRAISQDNIAKWQAAVRTEFNKKTIIADWGNQR